VARLPSRLAVVEERFKLLELSLNWRFRDGSSCVHLDGEGYCLNWVFKSPVKEWRMKKVEGGYLLRVQEHRWVCALCPSFMSKNFANEYLKRMNELIELVEMVLARLPAQSLRLHSEHQRTRRMLQDQKLEPEGMVKETGV